MNQLNGSGGLPLPTWSGSPVLTDAEAIHRVMLEANADPNCVGVIAWMHTFSPAKMWITGLDALRNPLLHLHTQANVTLPWAEIDMDFMNLNQAAHGDREFGYIQTRLGVPARPWSATSPIPSPWPRIAAWQRAALGAAAVRQLKLARFGDNMRDVAVTEGDKVEAQLRFGVSVNTYGVNDLVALVDEVSDGEVDELIEEYADSYDDRTGAGASAVTGMSRCATARGSRPGCAHSLTDGGFGAFTTNFQDLGGLRQLPGLAVQRLMAEGYGFGGEGDWKTSVLLHTIKAMGTGDCRAAPPSWRTTRTTGGPGHRRFWALTCSRYAPALRPAGPGSRFILWASETARIR